MAMTLLKRWVKLWEGAIAQVQEPIYPTLNYLEEQQFVRVELSDDERKQYRITALGLKHLEVEQANVEKILSAFRYA